MKRELGTARTRTNARTGHAPRSGGFPTALPAGRTAWSAMIKKGIVYHREGIWGDYDQFDDVEDLRRFIRTGEREKDLQEEKVNFHELR